MRSLRRLSRLRAALVLLAGVLALRAAGHAAEAARPNIVFIFADDWGRYANIYHATRPAGAAPNDVNAVVRTPHFDALAQQGVLFRNAHVASPSCSPSRSALLTGQYFWRTGRGAILQGAVWDSKLPAFPLLLRDSGYHIGKSYKVWSPGSPVDAPFDGTRHSYEKAGRRFNQFSQHVTRQVANGVPLDQAKQAIYQEIRANFQQFLAARKPDQPFLYWFGPTNTHRQWQQGSGKALWSIDPDSLKGKLPPFLPDVPKIREDFADYLGEVAALDAAIGVLVEELKKSGDYANTLLVLSGDHGIPGFPNGKCNLYDFGTGVALAITGPGVQGGRVVDDLVSLPDLAPTFLEAAGVSVPEVVTGRSLWSVLRAKTSGQVDPARTWVLSGRERHVARARAGFLPYPQRAIRTHDHLYIINFHPERYPMGDPNKLNDDPAPTGQQLRQNTLATLADWDASPTKAWIVLRRDDPQWKPYFERAAGKRPREELYDLRKDPYETVNVAADPAYAKIKTELEARLLAELKRTGDPRMENDGAYYETPPLAGPAQ